MKRFRLLFNLGCDRQELKSAIRSQAGVYFAIPLIFALVHCIFGLTLVGFLALMLGSSSYFLIVGSVILATMVFMGVYYLLTCRECERVLLAA